MLRCDNCSIIFKNKRNVKHCLKCGNMICAACTLDDYCLECHPANVDAQLINDYFEEKYKESSPIQ